MTRPRVIAEILPANRDGIRAALSRCTPQGGATMRTARFTCLASALVALTIGCHSHDGDPAPIDDLVSQDAAEAAVARDATPVVTPFEQGAVIHEGGHWLVLATPKETRAKATTRRSRPRRTTRPSLVRSRRAPSQRRRARRACVCFEARSGCATRARRRPWGSRSPTERTLQIRTATRRSIALSTRSGAPGFASWRRD